MEKQKTYTVDFKKDSIDNIKNIRTEYYKKFSEAIVPIDFAKLDELYKESSSNKYLMQEYMDSMRKENVLNCEELFTAGYIFALSSLHEKIVAYYAFQQMTEELVLPDPSFKKLVSTLYQYPLTSHEELAEELEMDQEQLTKYLDRFSFLLALMIDVTFSGKERKYALSIWGKGYAEENLKGYIEEEIEAEKIREEILKEGMELEEDYE